MHRPGALAFGEIWIANLDPVAGHEQSGRRPVVIVSDDRFNRSPAGLVIVAPMTRTDRGIPWHVRLSPPDALQGQTSIVLCDAIRSISLLRLTGRYGVLSQVAMDQIADRLRLLLRLP
jgi:mRNA interferase MazF